MGDTMMWRARVFIWKNTPPSTEGNDWLPVFRGINKPPLLPLLQFQSLPADLLAGSPLGWANKPAEPLYGASSQAILPGITFECPETPPFWRAPGKNGQRPCTKPLPDAGC